MGASTQAERGINSTWGEEGAEPTMLRAILFGNYDTRPMYFFVSQHCWTIPLPVYRNDPKIPLCRPHIWAYEQRTQISVLDQGI